ncbi:TlpA family protein disulfide reductase [Lysobacter sp. A3-1-A15]|uniref:TlpA family protein disulfide reductase n=1 Tax=Novilysobacter viscosus TaxID=3098602 RepID=UPI002ED7DA7F
MPLRTRAVARPAFTFLLAFALAACDRGGDAPGPTATDDAAAKATAEATEADAPPAGDTTPSEPVTPRLSLPTLGGATYDLADHRGKWVVVNFWATWCAPCLKEMPELSALDAMNEHIEVVGLAYEEIDEAAMRAFLEKHPVVYPIAILDVTAPPEDFETPRGLPMTYLIAPDGRVADRFLGPVTAHELEAAIAAAGGPAAGPGDAADPPPA